MRSSATATSIEIKMLIQSGGSHLVILEVEYSVSDRLFGFVQAISLAVTYDKNVFATFATNELSTFNYGEFDLFFLVK